MEQPVKPYVHGSRSPAQVREHYEVEKRLATQLREASKDDRKRLYSELYDELFQRVPYHPLLTRKTDPAARARTIRENMLVLKHFLSPTKTYAEIGPGDCTTAMEVARHVKRVYAVDVSEEVTRLENAPSNFELIISDGTSVPVPEGSVDVVFSNQLMEHLHPDDAPEQLHNIYRALAPGGVYICLTPNGFTGPHDVSKYFDDVATGFHLKEYTTTELHDLFRAVGIY